jgi:NADH-quinone oxidoreductase subunit F
MRYGAEWYASIGAKTHPGPFLYGISGHVNRPGIYEYPTGMLITDLVYKVAGGMKNGKKLKAVIPGGVSVPILRADMIEGVRMDTDSLAAAGLDIENGKYGFPLGNRKIGSMMGTGGMVIMNEDTDMVKLVRRISQFFHHESCGQCTPCREGTGWLEKLIIKIDEGRGEMKDLDLLFSLTENMEGRTVCMLADASAWPVRATIIRFREEFEAKVKNSVYAVS